MHGPMTCGLNKPTLYFEAHQNLYQKLGLSFDYLKDTVVCRFTEEQARAFMLLHILMHELGHHFDHITQKHIDASRGEVYAERFATSRFDQLFPAYIRIFGHPNKSIASR